MTSTSTPAAGTAAAVRPHPHRPHRRTLARRLVITADDLGLDETTNATIVDLLRAGQVSATTLMPVAPAAVDGARRARAAGVEPHLHVTLTSAREFRPWLPLAADVPSLTDDDGALHRSPATLERRGTAEEVVREITAQLGWMHRAGLRPAAMDSHSGTLYGMHGRSFAEEAVRLCAEHGLDLRVPRRLSPVLTATLGPRFRRAHAEAVVMADASGVRLPEVMASCWLPGRMLSAYGQLRSAVLAQLRRLPAGTSELVVHPAPPAAARRLRPAEGRKRVWELRLLRDPRFWNALARERIDVVPAW
ncbi:ChbG/HpnK family deacetylase [Georgenia sp. TF02-10]|uniref:carbohydrate deacetylase n=1 Tax=Georgenia sp. TF02-10 TaxID=2917725 RepID=UPI001FA7B4BF|nr:ChbG/HpnK family deacetylase [Georgenia sp. TF02-10]UNX55804.1 ChbG/HpnK family deacetylase [Georgenia sp. TF02-10]